MSYLLIQIYFLSRLFDVAIKYTRNSENLLGREHQSSYSRLEVSRLFLCIFRDQKGDLTESFGSQQGISEESYTIRYFRYRMNRFLEFATWGWFPIYTHRQNSALLLVLMIFKVFSSIISLKHMRKCMESVVREYRNSKKSMRKFSFLSL